jgi:hypothetical protein
MAESGRGGLPPGTRLQAAVSLPGTAASRATQLRILGDERRGYLLAGLADLPEPEEFWFATLEEALAHAERHGVSRSAWSDITAVGEVITEAAAGA